MKLDRPGWCSLFHLVPTSTGDDRAGKNGETVAESVSCANRVLCHRTGVAFALVLSAEMMNSEHRSAVGTLIAGLGLLVPASVGLLASGVPTILCPLPTLTVLPAFLLSNWHLWKIAVILPTLLFFLWNPRLFTGAARIPRRTYLLFALASLLSVVYFIASWKLGLQYQGIRYVYVVAAMNILWVVFLGIGFVRSWRKMSSSSFTVSLFLHWMLFAWLAWYAFPYLGELP